MKRNTSALTVLAAMVAIVGLVFAVPAFAAKPGGGDDDAVLSQHVRVQSLLPRYSQRAWMQTHSTDNMLTPLPMPPTITTACTRRSTPT
jgi:hypothetical protein